MKLSSSAFIFLLFKGTVDRHIRLHSKIKLFCTSQQVIRHIILSNITLFHSLGHFLLHHLPSIIQRKKQLCSLIERTAFYL